MILSESEVLELKKLINCSVYYGYKTNNITIKLARNIFTCEELEELEMNNIGESFLCDSN